MTRTTSFPRPDADTGIREEPTVPLPEQPSLEQSRKQARDLQRAARVGSPDATDLVTSLHRFDATPLEWVRHEQQDLVVNILQASRTGQRRQRDGMRRQ